MLPLKKPMTPAEASMQIAMPDLPGSQSQPKLLVEGEDVVGNCLGQLQCTEERRIPSGSAWHGWCLADPRSAYMTQCVSA